MKIKKKALREEYIRRRDGISSSLIKIHCDLIRSRLSRVPEFSEAKTVAGYHSIGSEVDTRDILRDLLVRNIRLCLPLTESSGRMYFMEVKDLDSDLQLGEYDILEPRPTCKQCIKQDVILVPAVCVTNRCQRIGYGMGCYDRYLSKCNAFTIGLVFESQIVKSIPLEPSDVPLDMIVSERHTYRR
ncbi:MAG: 5-formyltetrahydrofolate cyclo-ligase [Cenarchaeum symbiont of Oopsacas minuta]|nr:5-formyltetrahydrofolate cyclo-ligase [Cenarchaeum symbiont of Oopsacas minuta]